MSHESEFTWTLDRLREEAAKAPKWELPEAYKTLTRFTNEWLEDMITSAWLAHQPVTAIHHIHHGDYRITTYRVMVGNYVWAELTTTITFKPDLFSTFSVFQGEVYKTMARDMMVYPRDKYHRRA